MVIFFFMMYNNENNVTEGFFWAMKNLSAVLGLKMNLVPVDKVISRDVRIYHYIVKFAVNTN